MNPEFDINRFCSHSIRRRVLPWESCSYTRARSSVTRHLSYSSVLAISCMEVNTYTIWRTSAHAVSAGVFLRSEESHISAIWAQHYNTFCVKDTNLDHHEFKNHRQCVKQKATNTAVYLAPVKAEVRYQPASVWGEKIACTDRAQCLSTAMLARPRNSQQSIMFLGRSVGLGIRWVGAWGGADMWSGKAGAQNYGNCWTKYWKYVLKPI